MRTILLILGLASLAFAPVMSTAQSKRCGFPAGRGEAVSRNVDRGGASRAGVDARTVAIHGGRETGHAHHGRSSAGRLARSSGEIIALDLQRRRFLRLADRVRERREPAAHSCVDPTA